MRQAKLTYIIRATILTAVVTAVPLSHAQDINLWMGNGTPALWSDAYKWKLRHAPEGEEAVHFRKDRSIITLDHIVELNNGMMLYGDDLVFEGIKGNLTGL